MPARPTPSTRSLLRELPWATGTPKSRTGNIEAIRILTVARRSAASEWIAVVSQMRLNTEMRPLVRQVAPSLLEVYGVGFDVAAKLLIAAGDNPHRIRSEAAWAHLCGGAPIPASSGKIQRHRLNRGGHRQANSALYRIMLTRMSSGPRTKAYIAKRTADGKTMGEVARILKRYIAREIYPHLPSAMD